MPIICSTVKEIDNLYIHALPSSKPLNVVKAVRVGRITVFVGKNGKLYSNDFKDVAYTATVWPWTSSLMICLNKLDIITDEQMAEHMKRCVAVQEKRSKKYALESMERHAKDHGFKLSEEQIAALSV